SLTLCAPRQPCQRPALGQFASPDPLSPRLAVELLSSNSPAAAARPTSRSPGYPYPLASPAARPASRTPRAASALAPRLSQLAPVPEMKSSIPGSGRRLLGRALQEKARADE